MYPYLRWLGIVLRRRDPTAARSLLATSVLRFHVYPGDLDFFLHMNNGRFLTLMDSGRFDLMAQSGILPHLRRNRWISVLGGATILFRRPLRPFQRFELRSRILGWDAKWFYVEQRFEAEEGTAALAYVRGLFRGRKRSLSTSEVLRLAGWTAPSPELPNAVREWAREQDEMAAAAGTPQPV